jgi:aminoglycoside phosphotransferase family enzyme
MGENEGNDQPDDTLRKVGKLFGQIGWNKKFTELDEQDVLYLVMAIQQMEKLEDADKLIETYLAAIWLKFNIGDKEAKFPFGKNVQNDTGKS